MSTHDQVPDAYKVKSAWLDGALVPSEAAVVPLMAYTLHYGLGVFEGIRAYHGDLGPAIFRAREHMERLHRSAALCRLTLPFSVDELVRGSQAVLADNGLKEGYLRPIAFVDDGKRGLGATNNRVRVGICVWPWGAYLGDEGMRRGIRAQVSAISRMSMRAFMPKGKICGQYVNSIMAKRAAQAASYDEAILLDEHGYVAEASGENVFIVKGNTILTPPTSQPILEGITRESIMQLAKHLGLEVREERFARDALIAADEVFLCGTAAEVTPVREIDGYSIGRGERGPVTERVQSTYLSSTRGRVEGFAHWLTPYAVSDAAR